MTDFCAVNIILHSFIRLSSDIYYKVLPSINCHKTDHKMTIRFKFTSTIFPTIFRVWEKYVVNKIWKSALENLNVVCALFI